MNQEKIIDRLQSVVNALRVYHQHEVIGIEKIPSVGRVLVVVNHSFATYDISLLIGAIYDEYGRIPRPLADKWFFKVPIIGEFVEMTGAIEGNQENAEKLLLNDEIVTVAPGGMREALRPSTERYQILWEKRKGFIKLAIKTGSPIVIAVCPKADDLFDIYPNQLTSWAYKKFKLPLALARGVGMSPIPRPVQLTHFLSDPIFPPKAKEEPYGFKQQVNRMHKKVIKRTQELIGEAIAFRKNSRIT